MTGQLRGCLLPPRGAANAPVRKKQQSRRGPAFAKVACRKRREATFSARGFARFSPKIESSEGIRHFLPDSPLNKPYQHRAKAEFTTGTLQGSSVLGTVRRQS